MADGVKRKPNGIARNWSAEIIRREQVVKQCLKLVKTICALFLQDRIAGYVSRASFKAVDRGNDMKSFAATLTAARLEKALAFYMTPEAQPDGSADAVKPAGERQAYETRDGERARNTEDGVEAW
ncbi:MULTISPECIES: hypothetical protein [Rhizobium]|nr:MULTISPECIES: hypothetical protein [Rhizobium]